MLGHHPKEEHHLPPSPDKEPSPGRKKGIENGTMRYLSSAGYVEIQIDLSACVCQCRISGLGNCFYNSTLCFKKISCIKKLLKGVINKVKRNRNILLLIQAFLLSLRKTETPHW